MSIANRPQRLKYAWRYDPGTSDHVKLLIRNRQTPARHLPARVKFPHPSHLTAHLVATHCRLRLAFWLNATVRVHRLKVAQRFLLIATFKVEAANVGT